MNSFRKLATRREKCMAESGRGYPLYWHTFSGYGGDRVRIIVSVTGDMKPKDGNEELWKLKMKGYMAVNQGESKVLSGIKWLNFKSSYCLQHLCSCEGEHSTSYEAVMKRSMVDSWKLLYIAFLKDFTPHDHWKDVSHDDPSLQLEKIRLLLQKSQL